MKDFSLVRAALTLSFLALTAQSAAALSCPAKTGDAGGDTAAQSFANATLDQCSIIIGSSSGHYIQNWGIGVQVLFFDNGSPSTPASRSLSCTGSTGTNNIGNGIAATFASQIYTTTCSLSYTDANGQTVSHSFDASTSMVFNGISNVALGHHSAFSVVNGWFDRVAPTVVLSGLSGTIGAGGQTITAAFNEDVKDFVAGDLDLTNVTVSGFTTVTASSYTFVATPMAAGAVSVQIPAASLTDLPNNDNEASNTLSATADLTTPGVAITGLPASISGPTVFNATITFDETVTEFVAADITISGGSVTALSGSGAVYTASVAATGGADLVMSIAANVAADGAGNGNTASATATATNVTATETGALIAQFMQGRANALLANQPDLAGFLRGGAGHFNADVSRWNGLLSFDSGSDAPIWAQLNANWSTNLGAESTYVFGALGGHSTLSENLLLGGMVQVDVQNETNGAATISGSGWLVGPYFVAKLPGQPLYFEGSLLYGQTSNEISPLGTYTDSFSTERWLATLGVSGQIEKQNITLIPFLDAAYTSDRQAEYVDSVGNTIATQSITLAQVSAGLDFELPLGAMTTVNGGASGVWSYSEGTGAAATVIPGYEGGRARVDLGVNHRLGQSGDLLLQGYYDGIGTPDFESFGLELNWRHVF